VQINVTDYAEIESIQAKQNAQLVVGGDVKVGNIKALNLVVTALGTVELGDVIVVGHVELNSAGRMSVNMVDSNSQMLTAGSSLNANTLSSYGPIVISAINVNLGKVEGYDVDVTVDKDLQYAEILTTRDVSIKSNGSVVAAEASKITALYGNVTIVAKQGLTVETGAEISAQKQIDITAGGSDVVLHGSMTAQKVVVLDAAKVDVIADAKLQILEISTEADNAEVKLDMTNASGCNVTLNLAGQKDSVTILNAADKAEFAVYADKVDLKD
jgi:hypothetical protein